MTSYTEKPIENEFKAIDFRIIGTSGREAFAVDLVSISTGETAILYFNNLRRSKGKRPHYAVSQCSKLANLYRACYGEVRKARLAKSEQLVKHFIKRETVLICRVEISKHSDGKIFNKVIFASPKLSFSEDDLGNGWEKTEKQLGNDLEINGKCKSEPRPSVYKGVNPIGATDKCSMLNGLLLNAPSSNIHNNTRKNNRCLVFHKQEDETSDELYQRAIDATF